MNRRFSLFWPTHADCKYFPSLGAKTALATFHVNCSFLVGFKRALLPFQKAPKGTPNSSPSGKFGLWVDPSLLDWLSCIAPARCMDDIRTDEPAWQCPVCNNKLHDTEELAARMRSDDFDRRRLKLSGPFWDLIGNDWADVWLGIDRTDQAMATLNV